MSKSQAQNTSRSEATDAAASLKPGDLVRIGKDVLELLSSAMYVDPLSIYREYVQNAADAIDDARTLGLLSENDFGTVAITLDPLTRSVRIRDNGKGLPSRSAARTLLAVGGSAKRGTKARGFRGVGRLAGLAYCRELVFRTRANAENVVLEMRWDCVRLRAVLRATDDAEDLPAAVDKIVSISRRSAIAGEPARYFEVELREVVRGLRNDCLLNGEAIGAYLSQVAPVPFSTEFRLAEPILNHLAKELSLRALDIRIDQGAPLARPFEQTFQARANEVGRFSDLELISFDDRDGNVAAVGWIAHHEYLGALPPRSRIGGVRLRCGDIQVGTEKILEGHFPEPRFNGWVVGELHVLDPRIIPNARRDDFEENVHFSDLTAKFEVLARSLAKRCRDASILRNRERAVTSSVKQLEAAASSKRPPAALRDALRGYLKEIKRYLKSPDQATSIRLAKSLSALEILLEK